MFRFLRNPTPHLHPQLIVSIQHHHTPLHVYYASLEEETFQDDVRRSEVEQALLSSICYGTEWSASSASLGRAAA